jgi:hypothetical protein
MGTPDGFQQGHIEPLAAGPPHWWNISKMCPNGDDVGTRQNVVRGSQWDRASPAGQLIEVLSMGLVTYEVGVGLRIAGHQRRNRVEPAPRDFQRMF